MRFMLMTTLLALLLCGCGTSDSGNSVPTAAVPIVQPTKEELVPTPNDQDASQPRVTPTFIVATANLSVEPAVVASDIGGVAIIPPYDTGIHRIITVATTDLSQRLGVDIARIEVLEVRSVTWPDPGMGCPQPGMAYKQVQVDGMFLQLRVDGQAYNYHSGNGRDPFLCTQAVQKSDRPGGDLSK